MHKPMLHRTLIFAFLLFAFVGPATAQSSFQQEVNDLEVAAKAIMTRFPQDKYFVIGIGRSPTLLMAYYSLVAPDYTAQVPLTHFKYSTAFAGPLTESEERVLFQHFDQFIPDAKLINGKQILLLDFVENGHSLIAAAKYLNKYFAEKGVQQPEVLAMISSEGSKADLIALAKTNGVQRPYTLILDHSSYLTQSLHYQMYDEQAKFGAYDIKKPSQIKINPEYEKLRAQIFQEIKAPACSRRLAPPSEVHW
jgi:hypothetical protein